MSKNRTLANIISNDTSKIKSIYTDSDSVLNKTTLGLTVAAGTATYSSVDSLPGSASDGDQALVTSTNRLYIYSGSGWYNIALINNTPYWVTQASSSYTLAEDSTPTVVTILAVDSDGTHPSYSAVTDSDFDAIATISKDSDNGRVFTIVPIDSDGGTAIGGNGTVTFKASDGVNLATTLSTFSIRFVVPSSSYTLALQQADATSTDTQVDASGNSYSLTEVGGISSRGWTPYHPGGYSIYFDGSGDNLLLDYNSSLNLDSDFTIECWFYANAYGGMILNMGGGSGIAWASYEFVNSTDGINFAGSSSNSGYDIGSETGATGRIGTIELNTWNHLAVTRNGNVYRGFVNGTQGYTQTLALTPYDTSTRGLAIGSNYATTWGTGTPTNTVNGYIRDLRIVKGTAVYTSAFTPPTKPLTAITNTVLLACHLPYIADGSSNNHVITVIGNSYTQRYGPYDYIPYTKTDHGGSVIFDGSSDYITTNSTDTAGTGDFTVEAWVWWSSSTNTWQTIIAQRSTPGGPSAATEWTMGLNTTGYVYLFNGAHYVNSVAGLVKVASWNHIAIVRESGVMHGYVNGIKFANQQNGTNTNNLTYQNISLGANADGTEKFQGFISNARVVFGTAVYSGASFTPPTSPLTAITGTSILTCTNTNNLWDTAQGRAHVKYGNTTITNTQRKFATGSAIYLDGTGDYITHTLLHGPSGDFTIEGWFYSTNSSNRGRFSISAGSSGLGTGTQSIAAAADASGFKLYTGSGETSGFGGGNQLLNTWQHYALVRSGSTMTLYVDGTAVRSATNSVDRTSHKYVCIGGYYSTSYTFQGYVQDFRITINKARYTANFTPPTEQLEG